ncbi:hypothetical protein WJX84_007377 [Apatococcus fuscideae]|uniref:Nudix hydrolase domain-containing protein n=1 Tax=Apatococcus fuscideae TaxID=2026836 RepID=A0AAW1T850_9CHLO
MSQPRPGYRKNVGVCLVNRQGLVLAGRRPKVDTPWQLPQGGIDEGESPGEAAARELQEETGISQASIISQAQCWLDYDFPAGHRGWGNFPGQTQMWFLMLYHGDGSDINLNQHDPPEFDSFQWMSLQELPSQVVPFKRKIYEELAKQFVPVIEQLQADQG